MAYPGTASTVTPLAPVTHGLKPVPDPDDLLTRPFWAAAAEERLVLQRCSGCAAYHHPPVGVCPDCLSDDLAFEPVDGRGRVYSFVVVRDQRLPAFDSLVPYLVASVALDAAPHVTLATNLPGTGIDEVRIGMPVEVEFEEIAPGVRIPQFHATDEVTR
ncbi:Zn-ribbon domain-containing OB-fold protein [Pseudonocardia sp. RS010]|uniref:Zn-ribbon domain-containing OB-fold protein n=1 Tax=Pseudonocardia sp. RS010 TaxID=3385979 RepID=UPI0039A2D298